MIKHYRGGSLRVSRLPLSGQTRTNTEKNYTELR
jgi:hypothetical protein